MSPPEKGISLSITLPPEFVQALPEYTGNATKCLIFFRRLQLERNPVLLRKFIITCSYETIRFGTGIKSNVAIKSAVGELLEKGWIESVRKGRTLKGRKERESNTYVFVNPDGVEPEQSPMNATLINVSQEITATPEKVQDTIKDIKRRLKKSV